MRRKVLKVTDSRGTSSGKSHVELLLVCGHYADLYRWNCGKVPATVNCRECGQKPSRRTRQKTNPSAQACPGSFNVGQRGAIKRQKETITRLLRLWKAIELGGVRQGNNPAKQPTRAVVWVVSLTNGKKPPHLGG